MNERRLILTIAVGEEYQKIAEYTHPTLRRYAERIGADFKVIDESNCTTPHWEKFQIYQLLNQYDRIIYLDTDLIVRDDCPDLFEIVPKFKLGAFNEAPFTGGRMISIYETCKEYGETLPGWNGKYYNTGVMVISARHNHLFKKPDREAFNFYEQGYLNMQIAKENVEIYDLSYQFNRMTCMDRYTGEERFASYIIHYAGYPSLQFIQNLIPNDIVKWEADSPEYQYQRHILVDVQGGLGDQVCAEPAIRYMKEHVYPGDDISIVTHFPRLFEHLELPVFCHGEFQPQSDTPYYHVVSLPGSETPMWAIVSNLLCHTVDFCSMALLRRILPLKDKQIKLGWSLDDLSEVTETAGFTNLQDLVLIHPGRHWESKTFPAEWWQDIIQGLCRKNIPVCLIGRDDETRGTVDIEVPHGVIDSRDRLSLGGLIALIANAQILLSNDSAPIHLAGAFENYIILVPTCKHHEHILPFRSGNPYYKAKALYKKLALDDCETRPTAIHGATAEYFVGNVYNYLPPPDEVIKTVEGVLS